MTKATLPDFPYGAVYFRKSNPPEDDWARDYQTASEDGMNLFRHWFLWSALETSPGTFDWEEYDRQLDLAAKNGLKTIIAEMITASPEWAYRKFADARYERRDGTRVESSMSASCVTGGFPGLCLDHAAYKEAAGNFLTQLATRYREHPGLGGYDIWNECNYASDTCYCDATAAAFRNWLKGKYADLRVLGQAWHRYSFSAWEDITPPRDLGPYPHVLDWLQFRIDNAYEHMRWRADLIRDLDPDHPITAHGVVGSFTIMASRGADDWRAASEVESYGYTWGSSRHGDEPWKQLHAVDLVRASSRGKPFWHAEAYAGPLWMQPQVIGKPRTEGRIATAEDIRYWDMTSFMGGATGLLYLRWRPLLDGPLFGAFGAYGMDGSRTERSDMAAKIARWVSDPAQSQLWQSRPVKGDIGIVYVPETQLFTYAQQGDTLAYAQSMRGAYEGFYDNNIQADWVHIDDIDTYTFLYLPFPVMLSQATAEKLKDWVAGGGTLVSEGCPAYFGDGGHVGTRQPNYGLAEVFGAQESLVEFTPDLLGDLKFEVNGNPVWGGIFVQAYTVTTGKVVGAYEDGRVAAVDHTYKKGKTRLVGSMVGAGYGEHAVNRSSAFFADLLSLSDGVQHVRSSDSRVKARLHDGDGGTFLWVANASRQAIPVQLTLSEAWGPYSSARSLWGAEAEVDRNTLTLSVGARDVTVLELK